MADRASSASAPTALAPHLSDEEELACLVRTLAPTTLLAGYELVHQDLTDKRYWRFVLDDVAGEFSQTSTDLDVWQLPCTSATHPTPACIMAINPYADCMRVVWIEGDPSRELMGPSIKLATFDFPEPLFPVTPTTQLEFYTWLVECKKKYLAPSRTQSPS